MSIDPPRSNFSPHRPRAARADHVSPRRRIRSGGRRELQHSAYARNRGLLGVEPLPLQVLRPHLPHYGGLDRGRARPVAWRAHP